MKRTTGFLTRSFAKALTLWSVLLVTSLPAAAAEDRTHSSRAGNLVTPNYHLPASTVMNKPNILFVIMDDVGIDQLAAMGYGGATPMPTPTMNAIAAKGLRFRNTWSMPECSNGRMALLTGRYPFRTNVYQAIGPNDLANSHVSPYDVTVARMMKKAGYRSGLFGKYHLGGPENNQMGNGGPGQLGWDFFYGWIGGLPASIDTTAGGAGNDGKYSCGYVPSTARAKNGEGADTGACYIPRADGRVKCRRIARETLGDSPGLSCLNLGGVLAPNVSCEDDPPEELNFAMQNAHYVSQVIINRGAEVSELEVADPQGRNYRSSIEVNAAIDWINAQKGRGSPWMATVSFSADHTPLQPPPGHLLSSATRQKLADTMSASNYGTDCTNQLVQRTLSDAMIEAMDTELGRLLISTGLATKDRRGQIDYDPKRTNTLIVIVGDNGSFGLTVQVPFDIARSKASPYQTGIWVPLLVAGPMINMPNRDVPHLTNATDVYGLFGEVAGLNPHKASAPHKIDANPLLPYLVNPGQASIRNFNFAEGGLNIQKNNGHNGPCVIGRSNDSGGSCSQTPVSKSVCEDNGGVWWGEEGTSGFDPVEECWQVNQAIYESLGPEDDYDAAKVSQSPQLYFAARDSRFKLVETSWLDFHPDNPDGPTPESREELYEVNESKNVRELMLDREGNALYIKANGKVVYDALDSEAADAKAAIEDYVEKLFASDPQCPGDGNGDLVVNYKDLVDYRSTVRTWTGSSTFDFNYDAVTDKDDLEVIFGGIKTLCR